MTNTAEDQIKEVISENDVTLFMKGTPVFPQCGFSSQVVGVLTHLGVPFGHVNVLEDQGVREGIKAFSEITSLIWSSAVRIDDLAGDGDHYAANVISATFKGKSRIQQHQMVYAALQGRMGGELHALALQTSIPE